MRTQIAIAQKWRLWTEPKKTKSNVAYKQWSWIIALYRVLIVWISLIFFMESQWGNIALWGVWTGSPCWSHALPQRYLQVIFTLLPPLIIHIVLCLPWLELSISLVWKVQDITCLIKNIDSMFLHRECQTRPLCTLYCTLHMQTQYSPSLILNIKISQLRPNLC